MMKYLIASIFAICFMSSTALAQANCGERESVVPYLNDQYGETRQVIGVSGSNVFELWANEESGTWTVTLTRPDGVLCMISSGQHYQSIDEELPASGDPT